VLANQDPGVHQAIVAVYDRNREAKNLGASRALEAKDEVIDFQNAVDQVEIGLEGKSNEFKETFGIDISKPWVGPIRYISKLARRNSSADTRANALRALVAIGDLLLGEDTMSMTPSQRTWRGRVLSSSIMAVVKAMEGNEKDKWCWNEDGETTGDFEDFLELVKASKVQQVGRLVFGVLDAVEKILRGEAVDD
jgi:hypothetical protein